jgi:hypothetical protein
MSNLTVKIYIEHSLGGITADSVLATREIVIPIIGTIGEAAGLFTIPIQGNINPDYVRVRWEITTEYPILTYAFDSAFDIYFKNSHDSRLTETDIG